MSQNKTILIVDDHPFVREGLKSMIARILGGDVSFEVVGEAGTAKEALRAAREMKPDLCLMDISLPDQSGIELTREIRKFSPNTRTIIISVHYKIDYITEAFQAGAVGYIVKESASEKLMYALECVSKGEYYLDNAISAQVVHQLKTLPKREAKITDPDYMTLTSREQELMRILAEGLNINEISEKLCISPKTVKNHRTNIMRKLNIHSHHELVRYAAKLGLIDLDLWKT